MPEQVFTLLSFRYVHESQLFAGLAEPSTSTHRRSLTVARFCTRLPCSSAYPLLLPGGCVVVKVPHAWKRATVPSPSREAIQVYLSPCTLLPLWGHYLPAPFDIRPCGYVQDLDSCVFRVRQRCTNFPTVGTLRRCYRFRWPNDTPVTPLCQL